MKKAELLAPAGNIEAFYGAIAAGADAVYLSGKKYGARAYADNFETEEIFTALEYAHVLGKKVYLTVNTLLKNAEISELKGYLYPLYMAGLDGVIVQDIGAISFISEVFPDMEVHASTQATITGPESADLLKRAGVCRVVPAREMSLEELKNIKEKTGLEIESFVHGAMCYCYSGQCLFSSILGGRSGNRGRCAGPCRLPFSLDGKRGENTYPLSMKDMCTIEILPQILQAGVDSLKIEGRMKKAEYAAGVTAVYRKYLDLYYSGASYKVEEKDLDYLKKLYLRCELSTGYYKMRNGREMITLDSPAYNATDERIIEKIRDKYINNKKKLPVEIVVSMFAGSPVEVNITCGELTVSVNGMLAEKAQKAPLSEEKIKEKVGKLGVSPFFAERVDVYTDDNSFVPVGEINSLRRECVNLLINKILLSKGYGERKVRNFEVKKVKRNSHSGGISISVNTCEQYEALSNYLSKENQVFGMDIVRIYLDSSVLEGKKIEKVNGVKYYILTPQIIRASDKKFVDRCLELAKEYELDGFLVKSWEMLGALKNYSGEIIADENLYAFNSYAGKKLAELNLDGITLPIELNNKEIRELEAMIPDSLILERTIYGYIPMMVSANCIFKTQGKCYKGAAEPRHLGKITDRNKVSFTCVSDCRICMNTIYNSVPTYIDYEKYSLMTGDYRINFTIEDYKETSDVLNKKIPSNHTGGHNQRGVE